MTHDDHEQTIPPDVVPRTGLTLEVLRALDRMAGSEVTVSEPGEITLDVDGIPLGIGPQRATVATMCEITITQAEADSLGVDPKEFENVHII